MKKIITLLAIAGIFTLQSCTTTGSFEVAPITPIATTEVFEVTTSFSSTNNYSRLVTFNPPIYSSDVVLTYRLSGVNSQGDLWELLPETYYFNNGALDFGFRFDYTNRDVNIYMIGNDLQSVSTNFRINQVIRIVVVPASFANSINKNSYSDVITALNIKDNQIQKIDL
ncbi:hypothetical protein [Flavobacterium frigoris]|uniref:Dihydrolipoamide dehydrogenase n=1 Tax=Flavobacterium frigoris TaxID=229204 RepID=A0A1H9J7K4_FLAFI|nr:hypothetical protein [Flavobacterium frigoris]SEQ82840.1 hypothetical protein SAMN05444355_104236 [Flavobacterium frigoris]